MTHKQVCLGFELGSPISFLKMITVPLNEPLVTHVILESHSDVDVPYDSLCCLMIIHVMTAYSTTWPPAFQIGSWVQPVFVPGSNNDKHRFTLH